MKKNIFLVLVGLAMALQPLIWFVVYRKLYEWGKVAEAGLSACCIFSCVFMMALLGGIGAYIFDPPEKK